MKRLARLFLLSASFGTYVAATASAQTVISEIQNDNNPVSKQPSDPAHTINEAFKALSNGTTIAAWLAHLTAHDAIKTLTTGSTIAWVNSGGKISTSIAHMVPTVPGCTGVLIDMQMPSSIAQPSPPAEKFILYLKHDQGSDKTASCGAKTVAGADIQLTG